MNTLRVKTTINCDTCGCKLPRSTSIRVQATNIDAAKIEADARTSAWMESLKGQNCKVCRTIIAAVAAGK
jgi:hypothetical protein